MYNVDRVAQNGVLMTNTAVSGQEQISAPSAHCTAIRLLSSVQFLQSDVCWFHLQVHLDWARSVLSAGE